MNREDKDAFIIIVISYFLTISFFGLLSSCAKAGSAFYHQVIIKDQVVGQPKNY